MQPRGRLCGEKTWSVAILTGVYQDSAFKRYPQALPARQRRGGPPRVKGKPFGWGPCPTLDPGTPAPPKTREQGRA